MTDLPPKPDPQTGEPRPPAAPSQHRGVEADKKPARMPDPPEGQGPVLEYYRASQRSVWLSAPIPIIVVLALAVWHSGVVALTSWFVWVILAAYFVFLIYKGRSIVLTAGAEWVQYNRHWVRLYELTKIRYTARAQGTRWVLALEDRERGVEIPVQTLQSNKRLWDYVYLGLRHSVANGADIKGAVRTQFSELVSDSPTRSSGER